MCIVIDINVLHCVFDNSSSKHHEFSPVLRWIMEKEGKIVYGGSDYLGELKKTPKYLKIIVQLSKFRKAIHINDDLVDAQKKEINSKEYADFDDAHIVALLQVSKCRLICSEDARAFPYFRHRDFFPRKNDKPKIYHSKNQYRLLCRSNIVEVCLPCSTLNKSQKIGLKI